MKTRRIAELKDLISDLAAQVEQMDATMASALLPSDIDDCEDAAHELDAAVFNAVFDAKRRLRARAKLVNESNR